jgi:molecular chaperone Hsp33
LIRGLAAEGSLRILAADTTDIVEEGLQRHRLAPTPTALLGRAMTGALLLASLLPKTPRERLAIRLRGDGPLGGAMVEASPNGTVRGYVEHPQAEVPLRADGKLNVGGLLGQGELQVSRTLPNGEVYTSTTQLVSGEIAEDLTHYLWQSEQVPSAILLGVKVQGAERFHVERAGGILIQVMPQAPEWVLTRLEENLKTFPGITSLMEFGLEGAVEEIMRGLDYRSVDLSALGFPQGRIPLNFSCRCSREKALAALRYFDREERERMIAEDGGAEVVCHWCGEHYRLSPWEIRSLDSAQA